MKKQDIAKELRKADIIVADFDETFTRKNVAEILARKYALRMLLDSLKRGRFKETLAELKHISEILTRHIGKGYEGAAVLELLKQLESKGIPREKIVQEVQELRRKYIDTHGIKLLEELAKEKPVFLITFGPSPDIQIKGVKKIFNPVYFEGKKNLMYSHEEKQKALWKELKKLGRTEGQRIAYIGDKKEFPENLGKNKVIIFESPYAKQRFGIRIRSYKEVLKRYRKR